MRNLLRGRATYHDLNMSSVTQRSIRHIWTQDQRANHMAVCDDLISSAEDDGTFLNRIITEDET